MSKKVLVGYLMSINGKIAQLKEKGGEYETCLYYRKKYNTNDVRIMSKIYSK